jgi:hypothetical protein
MAGTVFDRIRPRSRPVFPAPAFSLPVPVRVGDIPKPPG